MNKTTPCLILIFLIFSAAASFSQDTTQSLAYKNNKPQRRASVFYQPDLSYRIWQQFNLIKEANAGDVMAEHELGIRYLLGDGMKADTVLGALWIKKAADKKLTSAEFNYAILLINGWGVDWNPFEAFNYFMMAAKDGMPQAQHIVGSLYTDNLIVKRDWNTAYAWIKKAYDAGYIPAKETLENITGKVDTTNIDVTSITGNNSSSNQDNNTSIGSVNNQTGGTINSSPGLVFIDFDAVTDTITKIENISLLEDLTYMGIDEVNNNIYVHSNNGKDSSLSFDSLDVSLILKYAENSSPEALTLLGRFYEEGNVFKKNLITAAAYYIRATRMDSPKAPYLLYEMLKGNNIIRDLKDETDKNNAEAMFVWHGLVLLGIDGSITEGDAFNLLNKSASLNYLPALTELGLAYYTGNMVDEDKEKAFSIWQQAEKLGSKEAEIRKETAQIFSMDNPSEDNVYFNNLTKAAGNGSLLALVTLAYCYENGRGVAPDNAEAVKNYRYAAQRGSQYAYKELKKIYDLARPNEQIFQVE